MSSLQYRLIAALAVALLLPASSALAQPAPEFEVSVGYFHESLAPYGRWVFVEPYGSVWVPADVAPEWRPYTQGSWVYTDVGWTWVSDEPWGWAPYHYGRWAFEPAYGWMWVPGVVWGPAWVAWRWGGGYVGWAPLAPVVGYEVDWIGGPHVVASFGWSFCNEREILERPERRVYIPRERVTYYVEHTRDVTAYSHDRGRVVSRAIDPDVIARATGRVVPVHHLVDSREAGPARIDGSSVRVFRPVAAPPSVVQRVFAPVGVQQRDGARDRRMPSAVTGREPGRGNEGAPRGAPPSDVRRVPAQAPGAGQPRVVQQQPASGQPRAAPQPPAASQPRAAPVPRQATPRAPREEPKREPREHPQSAGMPDQSGVRTQPAGIGRGAAPQLRVPVVRAAPAPRAGREERNEAGRRR